MNITIDIETIPTQRQDIIEDIRASIEAPGNYKKPESIAKWFETEGDAAFEEKYRKTALDGASGEIICICWAVDDGPPNGVIRKINEPEKDILQDFSGIITDYLKSDNGMYHYATWIGYNICKFDLRFIWQRCVINNIKLPFKIPYDAKPWGDNVFDTLYEWAGANYGGGSLDKVSKALGYEGKGEVTGSNVWDFIKAGETKKVFDYCKQDVELTRKLYKRMI